MSSPTGGTIASEVTEWIHSEQIGPNVIIENAGMPVHGAIATNDDASKGGSETFAWTREKEASVVFTYASAKTELDTAGYGDAIKLESDRATADAKVIGLKRHVSDEAIQDAGLFLSLDRVVENGVRAMMRRTSTDCLLSIQDATNSSSFSGQAFNRERFGIMKSALLAQNADGPFAFVGGNGHFRELEADARTTGASQIFRESAVFPAVRGVRGMYEGFLMIETSLVPAEDGDNDNGAGFVLDPIRSPFGLANWWNPQSPVESFVQGDAGVISFFMGSYKVEISRDPDGDGYKVWVKNRVAHKLTYNGNIREIIAID